MKIALYAQHCLQAGKECHDEEKIEQESDDLVIYEGTPKALMEWAEDMEKHADSYGAGTDRFKRRCAKTIKEALGI